MLIIVEGVDGTGKSTLCNKLQENLNCALVTPPGAYEEHAYSYWCGIIDTLINRLAICDRSFLSDLVYRLTDDRAVGTLSLLEMVLLLQRNKSVKIVHCKNEKAFLYAMERGEDNIVSKSLHDSISKNYETVFNILSKFTNVPIIEYDFTKDNDFDKVLNFIKEV